MCSHLQSVCCTSMVFSSADVLWFFECSIHVCFPGRTEDNFPSKQLYRASTCHTVVVRRCSSCAHLQLSRSGSVRHISYVCPVGHESCNPVALLAVEIRCLPGPLRSRNDVMMNLLRNSSLPLCALSPIATLQSILLYSQSGDSSLPSDLPIFASSPPLFDNGL